MYITIYGSEKEKGTIAQIQCFCVLDFLTYERKVRKENYEMKAKMKVIHETLLTVAMLIIPLFLAIGCGAEDEELTNTSDDESAATANTMSSTEDHTDTTVPDEDMIRVSFSVQVANCKSSTRYRLWIGKKQSEIELCDIFPDQQEYVVVDEVLPDFSQENCETIIEVEEAVPADATFLVIYDRGGSPEFESKGGNADPFAKGRFDELSDEDSPNIHVETFTAEDGEWVIFVRLQSDSCEDSDRDEVPDNFDNCEHVYNANQMKRDGDSAGDVCDFCPDNPDITGVDNDCEGETGGTTTEEDDFDNDGVPDGQDNCPANSNADQHDCDADDKGDACDPTNGCGDTDESSDETTGGSEEDDFDQHGVPDDDDNCPAEENPDQHDCDDDGEGDACDPTHGCDICAGGDADSDGVCNDDDNCPNISNPGQQDTCPASPQGDACDLDTDRDGRFNACDACPNDPQNDADHDGVCGDVDECPSDPLNDPDNDNICNGVDNCDTVANQDQHDCDHDGVGDVCDPTHGCDEICAGGDVDGDRVCDDVDNCPVNPNPGQEDCDRDGQGDMCDADDNNDCHGNDQCPNDPNRTVKPCGKVRIKIMCLNVPRSHAPMQPGSDFTGFFSDPIILPQDFTTDPQNLVFYDAIFSAIDWAGGSVVNDAEFNAETTQGWACEGRPNNPTQVLYTCKAWIDGIEQPVFIGPNQPNNSCDYHVTIQ